jgi:hypothetical protein
MYVYTRERSFHTSRAYHHSSCIWVRRTITQKDNVTLNHDTFVETLLSHRIVWAEMHLLSIVLSLYGVIFWLTCEDERRRWQPASKYSCLNACNISVLPSTLWHGWYPFKYSKGSVIATGSVARYAWFFFLILLFCTQFAPCLHKHSLPFYCPPLTVSLHFARTFLSPLYHLACSAI